MGESCARISPRLAADACQIQHPRRASGSADSATPAADEVILAAHGPEHFELHCHGGRRVVAWLVDLLRSQGAEEVAWPSDTIPRFADPAAAAMLPFARTVRTAGILLDQAHGALRPGSQTDRSGRPGGRRVGGRSPAECRGRPAPRRAVDGRHRRCPERGKEHAPERSGRI